VIGVFGVYCFEEMLVDSTKQLAVQNDLSILKLYTERNAPHQGKHKGIYLVINHLAIELDPFEMSFRQWLEEERSFRHQNKIFY
jgi:hypothetical protein